MTGRGESEARIRDILATLAGTLASERTGDEFFQSLMDTCVEVVAIDDAGLLLAMEGGGEGAASSDRAIALRALEVRYGEGPCLDSVRTGEMVVNVLPEEGALRWPEFWDAARSLGIEAAHAVPIRLRGQIVGSMGMFSDSRTPLVAGDIALAVAVANVATVGLLQERAASDLRVLEERINAASPLPVTIEQPEALLDRTSSRAAAGDDDAMSAPPSESRATQRQHYLEAQIQDALEQHRVVLAFQPVFDLSTGLIVSAEALLRLVDTDGHPLSPREVVPVAEASGLIVELGRRVLHVAAAQAARWRHDHGTLVPVAVNVSAVQLTQSTFTADVFAALERAGVPSQALTLELTESVLLESGSVGMDQLLVLRDHGVELAIDDFGTGYASLLYLRDLPATTLKIDRSFVEGVPGNAPAVAIVTGMIALARSFGMACIAEGIETDSQREYFAGQGVLGQGFLLARPADGAVVSRLIAEQGARAAAATREDLSAADARDAAGDRRDEAGAERDEAGDERDDISDRRDLVGDRRDVLADRRDKAGDRRDRAADQRDDVADERDRAGARRDTAATHRDDQAEWADTADESRIASNAARLVAARRAAASDRERALLDREVGARERADARRDRETSMTDRGAGANERVEAELDRTTAGSDRRHGADERARAGDDRSVAHTDRGASAMEREDHSVDVLSGAHSRRSGLLELEREIDRAARTGQSLIVAYIDVDNLKSVNDSAGHAAGDDLLRSVASALKAGLRSYDLVIRYGGDEFLCAMYGLTLLDAEKRLSDANENLSALPSPVSFTFGLARLESADTVEGLIARADGELYAKRHKRARG